MKTKFDVTGMSCSACSARIDKEVRKLEGVQDVQVNLLANCMYVNYDPEKTDEGAIISAVTGAGYGATKAGAAESAPAKKENTAKAQLASMKKRLIVSIIFLLPLMYLSMHHMFPYPIPSFLHGINNAVTMTFCQLLLTLPILYVNRKYYQTGFSTLAAKSPNMDSLIALSSSAAVLYGIFALLRMSYGMGNGRLDLLEQYSSELYFESAGMILTLITLGKYLETRSKGKTGEAIEKLMELAPETAVRITDGKETTIPIEQVQVGDRLLVRPGARIPVDGVILKGSTAVDQSAVTGESIPVEKKEGDGVISATINKGGAIEIRAQKVGKDTTLSQIIRLVEEASTSKAPIAKLADKVSGIFVPIVIGIALAAAVIWLLVGKDIEFALSTAISVLVISCPCALGLATPVAIMVGTGEGAKHGILIKSAESLETLHKVSTVVLDKTGTVTEGKPSVTDVIPCPGKEEELLSAAVSLEQYSEHPLAEAVRAYGKQQGLSPAVCENFQSATGLGIRGAINGQDYFGGSKRYLEELGFDTASLAAQEKRLTAEGKTPLYFASKDALLGMIAAADTIKESSRQAISALQNMGISVELLTGDNTQTAQAIADELGVTQVQAQMMPQDKTKRILALQQEGHLVAMVGDGINDAPALSSADVGIAIGAGTDIAMESADIVLMKNDLKDVVSAVQLSRAVIRNIKMNLFWAFFYNVIGIPLAAGLFYPLFHIKLSPMIGAAAMSLSSVCVVSNALRLKRFRPSFPAGQARNQKEPK